MYMYMYMHTCTCMYITCEEAGLVCQALIPLCKTVDLTTSSIIHGTVNITDRNEHMRLLVRKYSSHRNSNHIIS